MGRSFFQLNCQQATVLVERKLSRGISLWEQLRLRWHQRLCAYCKNYEDQSALIEKALQQSDKPVFKLPTNTKATIKRKISENA